MTRDVVTSSQFLYLDEAEYFLCLIKWAQDAFSSMQMRLHLGTTVFKFDLVEKVRYVLLEATKLSDEAQF